MGESFMKLNKLAECNHSNRGKTAGIRHAAISFAISRRYRILGDALVVIAVAAFPLGALAQTQPASQGATTQPEMTVEQRIKLRRAQELAGQSATTTNPTTNGARNGVH